MKEDGLACLKTSGSLRYNEKIWFDVCGTFEITISINS